ncbi:uncharacterized protein LOC128883625 isoform X2 [Hylaeus volcanicus]|uniref:uncharacterized protein LOC128883625 isoform X2 n=1 Tax=Hylaeus volcanicus TaxID=313075 RepID=UPI0023B7F7F1|nr:uncharacterized protein LOC128883625 isoform X2 [Hylaeus volcanicus]
MRTVTEKINNKFSFLYLNESTDCETLSITTYHSLTCNIREFLRFLESGLTQPPITEITQHWMLPDCNLIPLTFALQLLTHQHKKTSDVSEKHSALLCDFVSSTQRIKESIQWTIDVILEDKFFLSLKELLALLVDLPECIFCLYEVTRHSYVWRIIQWEFHASRVMAALLHIWNEKTTTDDSNIETLLSVDTKQATFLLVETTCYIIARQNTIFPFYLACYFSTSHLKHTTYVLSSFSIAPTHRLPQLIHNITKHVNKNSQAIRTLASLLIGATSAGIHVSKGRGKGFTFFGAPELIDFIFPNGLTHTNTLHYPCLTLKCLTAFIYAVDPNDDENDSSDFWYALWSALTRHPYSCAYVGVILVDALWFDLIINLVSEKKTTDATDRVNVNQNKGSARTLVAQRLRSLEQLWECLMRPVITDIPPLCYLVITLAKLRFLLTTRNVVRSNILAGYSEFDILSQISFKCVTIFQEVSSCLLSSIPSRVLSAQVMLSITGAILKIEAPDDISWNVFPMDSNASQDTILDRNVPDVSEWLPAILYCTEISDDASDQKSDVDAASECKRMHAAKSNEVLFLNDPLKKKSCDSLMENLRVNKKKNKDDDQKNEDVVVHPTSIVPLLKKSNFIEIDTSRKVLKILPEASLLTSVPPTCLRQCLERLSEPLRLSDVPLQCRSVSSLDEFSIPRKDETPIETYWRIRRALLTIPLLAGQDYEGDHIASKLVGVLLKLDDTNNMEDFQSIRKKATVSLIVAWPKSTVQVCVKTAFEKDLSYFIRVTALQILHESLREQMDAVGLKEKQTQDDSIDLHTLATLYYNELFRELYYFLKSRESHQQSTNDIQTILNEEVNQFFSQLLLLFSDLLNAAANSITIMKMLAELAIIFDIVLVSRNIPLRRSGFYLLAKYATIVKNYTEMNEGLGNNRVSCDSDQICRDIAQSILARFTSFHLAI